MSVENQALSGRVASSAYRNSDNQATAYVFKPLPFKGPLSEEVIDELDYDEDRNMEEAESTIFALNLSLLPLSLSASPQSSSSLPSGHVPSTISYQQDESSHLGHRSVRSNGNSSENECKPVASDLSLFNIDQPRNGSSDDQIYHRMDSPPALESKPSKSSSKLASFIGF